jgi:2-iminobutanoate/2-iminopropanoate deaminase
VKYTAIVIALLLAGAVLSGQTNATKTQVVLHQTASGKFIQVGNTYYSSGIAALQSDGTLPRGMAAQTRATLEKFEKAYDKLGLQMSNVVKVNIYITDEKLKSEMDAEYVKVFHGDQTPCRTAVTVKALDPGRLVEMEMVAVKP